MVVGFDGVALRLLVVGSALAHEDTGCAHDATTIASLRECVVHAWEMGHIDSDQVAQNLLKKLDKAQANLDHGKVDYAIDKLEDFIEKVQRQSGKHIDPVHAEHLIHHAHMVIAAEHHGHVRACGTPRSSARRLARRPSGKRLG